LGEGKKRKKRREEKKKNPEIPPFTHPSFLFNFSIFLPSHHPPS